MKPPSKFSKIVDQKRYSVETATLIASDAFWDGRNWERYGRNSFLYRTPRGAYFTVTLTQWQGERDTIEPISQEEAIELYERELSEHEIDYSTAFPGVKVEDA